MHRSVSLIFIFALGVFCPGRSTQAQARPRLTDAEIQARREAHENEFDFLLGDWELTVTNHDGRFRGRWSAVRLPETGQIVDEFRLLGDSGQTVFVSTSLRAYNVVSGRWDLVSVDAGGTGLNNVGWARKEAATIHVEQTFGENTVYSHKSRITYHDIAADRFSWNADRSLDGGKTWISNYQQIEAQRIGPPREFRALTRR